MSLPDGFLEELRNRASLAQVVGRKVMWDTRKSNQAKGDMWAPCPFHQEKSASFHVDDRQGFYYCFGCHQKGDAITFIRETENVGFMEAVEILAGEVGMTMPARDPMAQKKAEKRSELTDVMEEAVGWLRLQLKTQVAAPARDYLARRGLDDAAQERFDIGYAPDARQAMFQALTGRGIEAQKIIDAGLAAVPEQGGSPFDRFRGRIIFPIRDARGRCIALGGRSLDPNARAKYLNSPETQIFDKGRSLYNHGPAREAAGKGQPLIVAEGYMDVIALVEAGFGASVAPLGTAITEDQLRLLWRIHPEPVIALDGDTAGVRAARRLIDLALPLLEAGQTLRFCILPEGQDPDDLIRAGGPAAMQALLDQAQPLVRLLWQRETESRSIDSPERKAALDKALRDAVKKIADPSVRGHYGAEIRDLLAEHYGRGGPRDRQGQGSGQGQGRRPQGGSGWQNRGKGWQPPALPVATTKSSLLGATHSENGQKEETLHEAVILATLISNPALLEEFVHALEELEFTGEGHAALAGCLLEMSPDESREQVLSHLHERLGPAPLETLMSARHVQITPSVRQPGNSDLARLCLTEEIAKLSARRGAMREIAEAEAELAGEADEGLTWRLGQAAEAQSRAARHHEGDKADYDIAENGARMDRQERSAFDSLLETIDYSKSGRKQR